MNVTVSEPQFQPFTLSIEVTTRDEAEQLAEMVARSRSGEVSCALWSVLSGALKARGLR